jgi:uridine kinase
MLARRVDITTAVGEAVQAAARRPGRTVYLGIDGFGAAGKTSLATAIAERIARAQVVHIDDFADPGVPEWNWARFDAQVAAPLLAGRPARYQVGNEVTGADGPWRTVPGGAVVVVVEGVSSTRAEVRLPWDLTIWVDAPREVRLARALERDGAARMAQWLQDWMPSEEAYAAREQPQQRVDLIVESRPTLE